MGAARVGVNDMGLEERVKTQERHFARGSLEPVSLSLSQISMLGGDI